MNKCSGCSHDFTSLSAFDKHRVGSFTRNTRRCMTEAEMLAHGLERRASGKWGYPADPRFLARIAASREAVLAS